MSKYAKTSLVMGSLVLIYGALIAAAHAELPPSRCSAVVQFEPYLGDRCQTLKGGIFTLVWNVNSQAKGWRSETTGLVWFETMTRGLNQHEAARLCATQPGQSLPSVDDFIQAEMDGIRELFFDMRNLALWSGTELPGDPSQAYYFAGNAGEIGSFARLGKEENSAAICVSPAR